MEPEPVTQLQKLQNWIAAIEIASILPYVGIVLALTILWFLVRGIVSHTSKPVNQETTSSKPKRRFTAPTFLLFWGTLVLGILVLGSANFPLFQGVVSQYGVSALNGGAVVLGALLVWAMPTKLQKLPGILLVLLGGSSMLFGG